jgi:hypothetical protein
LQLAASRFTFEVLGDMVLGSPLANDSRQNLLAAHELCAKDSQSRPKSWKDEDEERGPHRPTCAAGARSPSLA